MLDITRSIQIEAPVEKVFEYVSDYRKWPEFYVGILDIKPITEITHANGARFLYKAKMMGMKVTLGTEFHQFKQNVGWTGISFKGMKHRTLWIFKESESGTEFTHGVSANLPWYMGGKLLSKKILEPEWIKVIEQSLENLKQKMEE
jgi:hypothetical protein